jgi:VanZ family protein
MSIDAHPHQPAPAATPSWPWWLAIALYFPATCLGHLQFSLWLVRRRAVTLGGQSHGYAYSDAVPWLAGAAVAALVWHLWRQAARSRLPWPVVFYWAAWAACAALVDRYLTYSVNEYAHYPQYGLLAWLLARALDPGRQHWPVARVLFWATLLGMVDELLQYLWITRSYSDYLDFNDFLVNLLAAAAGVMVYYGFSPRPAPPRKPRWWCFETALSLGVAAAIGLGIACGRIVNLPDPGASAQQPVHQVGGQRRFAVQARPQHLGAWLPGKRRPRFYVLPPETGVLLMLLAGGLFAGYPSGPISLRPRPRLP